MKYMSTSKHVGPKPDDPTSPHQLFEEDEIFETDKELFVDTHWIKVIPMRNGGMPVYTRQAQHAYIHKYREKIKDKDGKTVQYSIDPLAGKGKLDKEIEKAKYDSELYEEEQAMLEEI
jgi:hypothetical protein